MVISGLDDFSQYVDVSRSRRKAFKNDECYARAYACKKYNSISIKLYIGQRICKLMGVDADARISIKQNLKNPNFYLIQPTDKGGYALITHKSPNLMFSGFTPGEISPHLILKKTVLIPSQLIDGKAVVIDISPLIKLPGTKQ